MSLPGSSHHSHHSKHSRTSRRRGRHKNASGSGLHHSEIQARQSQQQREQLRLRQSMAAAGVGIDPSDWETEGLLDQMNESYGHVGMDSDSYLDASKTSFAMDGSASYRGNSQRNMYDDSFHQSLGDSLNNVTMVEEGRPESSDRRMHSGEEWKAINALFNYIDTDNAGKLETSEMVNALQVIGDKNLTKVIVDTAGDNQAITRELLYSLLFSRREPTKYQPAMLFVIIWALPVFYACSTRLPFICLALEITQARGGELWQVGLILGGYQTCRSIANAIISAFGGEHPLIRLNMIMVLSGLAGWIISFVEVGTNWGTPWSLYSLCLVGLAEVVVNLQTALIEETRLESPAHVADPGVLSDRLRSQYASVSAGSFFAYVIGGALFTYFGFRAICVFGMICQVLQMGGTAFYIFGYRHRQKLRVDIDGVTGRQLLRSVTYRIQAMVVLGREADRVSSNMVTIDEPGVTEASKIAQQDKVLTTSLKKLYRAFFHCSEDDKAIARAANAMSPPLTGPAALTSKNYMRASTKASLPIQRMLKSSVSLNIMRPSTFKLDHLNSSDHTNKSIDTLTPRGLSDFDFAKVALRILDTDGDGFISEKDFVSYLAPRVFLSFYGQMRLTAVSVVWPYMRIVVATQAVMALCIGTFLSTALLYYTQKFQMEASIVGLLLGIGEGLGAVVIYTSGWLRKRALQRALENAEKDDDDDDDEDSDTEDSNDGNQTPSTLQILSSRPLHVPMVLLIIGFATIGYSANSFAIVITFQMIMSALNDLSVTFLNELIATSIPPEKFMFYQGIGQWLRRLGNMLTGLLGPILFGIYPELPFLFFGGLVNLWTVMLWFVMWRHARQICEDRPDDELHEIKAGWGPVSAFHPIAECPWHVLEREYYTANKEEIDEKLLPRNLKFDLAVMDHQIRRIGAALRAEAAKREDLLTKLKDERSKRRGLEERVELLGVNREAPPPWLEQFDLPVNKTTKDEEKAAKKGVSFSQEPPTLHSYEQFEVVDV